MSAAAGQHLPLAGRRILVTRARHQAGQLSAQLAALGAEVIEIPAIEIQPQDSFDPLDQALLNLARYQWLIVTSANTVRCLRDRMTVLAIAARDFTHLQIAAVGSATTHALRDLGLEVQVTPEEYVAESLLAVLEDRLRGSQVLLVRAAAARDVIPATLSARGAHVDVVDAYRTVIPADSTRRIAELFPHAGRIPHAATFTSSSTVTNFFHLLQSAGIGKLPRGMKAISIGPITSQTLREHNWPPSAEANPHDLHGLIQATIQALSS
jgi:uroporphyrinogen-III synthase